MVAAVDVGILNLTNYKPPSPERLLSRPARALRRHSRSLRPIDRRHAGRARPDPHRRRRGRAACTAARRPGRRSRSIPASSPSARTAPPKSRSTCRISPARVRVMAVAWSKDKVGHATADVTVRDPVVLTATLPRFLLPGDRSTVHLDLDNVEGAGRRLRDHGDHRPTRSLPAPARRRSLPLRAKAARRAQRADHRQRGRQRHGQGQRQRARRLRAERELRR